jgi:cytochrome o ubiquinol oxidase subunit 2
VSIGCQKNDIPLKKIRRTRVNVFANPPYPTAGALLPAVLLAGCGGGVLSPAGPVGHAELTILLDSLAIMLVIVIPTLLATLTFAWWFRASNARARYLPTWSYSGRLELLLWSIPALVVLFLGGIAWTGSHDLDPAEPLASSAKPLEIEAVALDWKWLFIYPQQGVASVNRLVAPAGVPLQLRITSASVFNVFFVPQLGSEIYAMYGMVTRLNLQADRPGVYPGLSAHFSGDGFPDMAFDVQAVTPGGFAEWAAATRRAGPALDDTSYQSLLRQSENVSPYTYRRVRAGLFDEIVQQKLPPGEGPRSGRPSPQVSPRREK